MRRGRIGGSLVTRNVPTPMTTHLQRLDVRPILASGRDPFVEVMRAAIDVPASGTMVVIAPFDPVPLRDVLGRNGFTSTAVPRGPREWEVTFTRDGRVVPAPDAGSVTPAAAQARARSWEDACGLHVDTRGMAQAAALRAILDALDEAGGGRTIVAHLDANIEALYPELAARNCESAFVPGDHAEVRLEISTPA